jgi:cytochrome bd ubiquinol oxidase subunit II
MATVWFWLVLIMIMMYVILDGFDLGAGTLHLCVARTEAERRTVMRSIGPVWHGNEVWLLAAGGTLFFAFPVLFATAFSGFYLPLMMVLWLLIGRAIGIEFRHQIESPAWTPLWDVVFAVSSALLTLFFGVALGNVVRGVPLDASGRFFAPLWTDFRPYGATGILDWYTLAVGVAALAALAMHGALWITMKTDEGLQARSRRTALRLWWAVMGLMALVTLATFHVQPHVWERLRAAPWGAVLPLLAVSALGLARWCCLKRCDVLAFVASAGFLGAMLVTVAFSVFPYVLPASTDPVLGLTLGHAAAEPYALQVGLAWWIPGMVLVAAYFFFVYRQFAGKVRLDEEGHY